MNEELWTAMDSGLWDYELAPDIDNMVSKVEAAKAKINVNVKLGLD